MSELRTGRQRFYNVFSHFYDLFITMHSGSNKDETRRHLVDSSIISNTKNGRVLLALDKKSCQHNLAQQLTPTVDRLGL